MVKESGSSKPGNRFLRTDAAATGRRTGAEAGSQLEVTASLGAGGVDTRTSGLGDQHCWDTAARQGPRPAGGGALLSRMGWKREEYDPGSKRPRTRNWSFTPGSWEAGGGAGEVAASFRWGTCLGEPFKPPG